METLPPLQKCTVDKFSAIVTRTHTLIHSVAILFMLYYRLIINLKEIPISFLPYWFLIFVSELILSFLRTLDSAHIFSPVSRSVYPENLPPDDELPPIDVFVCTADPIKEPALGVMNTVLSAMAIDYPPEKVTVYFSDDGGSVTTLCAVREAWRFGQVWIPFCREFGVKRICPETYILMLDCDMHSNDPSSARQAMCFHLDPKISPSLAFVQFPQRFRNISKNDIYDSWRGKSRREVVFSLDVATS